MKSSLRHRLLAVALLSVISCAVALVALVRVVSLTTRQRTERARDLVTQELTALRAETPPAANAPPSYVLGMRGGHVAGPTAVESLGNALDVPTRQALTRVVRIAADTGAPAFHDEERVGMLVYLGAAPAAGGRFAWVVYPVPPPPFLWVWRFIVGSLTIATALLVATALEAVVSVKRGASTLNASLGALAEDLSAPVPRPPLRELAELGDGIARLAAALADARTEEERLGTELSRRERLAALGRVAAGVAHEVRNPLASIKLRVDLGRRRPETPQIVADELGFVSEEITRLDRLVADMLIVAGKNRGPRVTTALGPLVERRVELLRPWADERGVRIEVSGDASFEIDVDAIARALDNLVRNAVEASPRGATVEVRVERGEDAAIVRVLDHGAGVDQAHQEQLFEPFFTTKPEGTGLGLALSRAIVAAHDGAVQYARKGDMTCFEMSFPRGPRSRGRAETRQ